LNPKQAAVLFKRTYTLTDGSSEVIWWYYVTDENGKRHRFSLGTSLKTEARGILHNKLKSGDLWPAKGTSLRFQDFTENLLDLGELPLPRAQATA